MRDIMESASEGAQFTVFGDTYHSYVPLSPIYENMDVLAENDQKYFFVEQHYTLQPFIEQLRNGELPEDDFRQFNKSFNDDEFWGHSEMADMIIEATNQGLHVVAYDTRTTEELGLNEAQDIPPNQVQGYPQELLPAVQAAYDAREEMSFDHRSANVVKEIAQDDKASIFIGNRHIHGGHVAGDPENDFDGYLGDDTAKITMYYDIEQADEYIEGLSDTTNGLVCKEEDQPDFINIAAEGVQIATTSAVEKGLDTSKMMVADLPAPCYQPEEPRVISPAPDAPNVNP